MRKQVRLHAGAAIVPSCSRSAAPFSCLLVILISSVAALAERRPEQREDAAVVVIGIEDGWTQKVVEGIAKTGKRIWTTNEGALNPPLVVGGSVFVVNDQARLVRLDAATGEVIWSTEMPYFTKEKVKKRKGIFAHYGPVLAGGRIVVASSDGLLRMFDPTNGALVGQADIPSGAASAPALAGGMLFVTGKNGQLNAFR